MADDEVEPHIDGWDSIVARLDKDTLKRLGGWMTVGEPTVVERLDWDQE